MTTRSIIIASWSGAGSQTSFSDGWGGLGGDGTIDTGSSTQWRQSAPAATWRNMAAYIPQNAGATTWLHKLQKAGVNQNQVVSIPGTTTGWFSDASHTDSTSLGDLLNYLYTGGNFGNQHVTQNSIECESSSALQMMMSSGSASTANFNTSHAFLVTSGEWATVGTSTEAGFNQLFARAAGTLSGLAIFMSAAIGGSNTGTITFRKNAANGNQILSVTSAATGLVQDASHTDSIVAGDLYNTDKVGTGTGGSFKSVAIYLAGMTSAFDLWAGSAATSNFGGQTTAAPFNIGGPFDGLTPETSRQMKVWRAFTVSNLRVWMRTLNWGTATSATFRCRVNAANGNQIISLTNANTTSTWYEDASHTDSLSANDLVNTNFIMGSAASQIIFARIGLTFNDGSAGGGETGTIAQTFSGFSQSATGGLGNAGAIAQTFSGFSQAASGFIEPIGEATQTFSAFSQQAHGIGAPGAPRTTQLVRLAITMAPSAARSTQLARLAIAGVTSKARTTQAARLTVAAVNAKARTTQLVRLTIADSVPCGTTWCQCWRITRRDGRIFRFTSLDEDFLWGIESFSACASLNPSATESATALGSVGNIELTGIIADSAISAGDLYGGLFDDAFVEVWLVDYSGSDTPKRIAAGWTGDLSQEAEGTFKMEVIGPGARLGQQALTQGVAPRCRWVFGDDRCGVDREARALTGCTVMFATNRGDFTADINAGTVSSGLSSGTNENDSQWVNGKVRFESGDNAGQECETKSIDFESGQIVLWALPAYEPAPGDEFTLLPGCGQAADDCKFYANFINFGGFDDVPGDDSLAQVPDAKL